MAKILAPRKGSFMGMEISGSVYCDGTWLEDEAFAYPDGGFTRRVYALCADGKKRILKCSIPDTYFSIPARGRINGKYVRGYISTNGNGGVSFHIVATHNCLYCDKRIYKSPFKDTAPWVDVHENDICSGNPQGEEFVHIPK
jgi:hypothetical protein